MKLFFLVGLAALFLPASAFADSIAPPCSYVAHSANKQFAFVMLAPVSDTECSGLVADQARERKDLRKRFPASGVYAGADPKRPVWTLKEPWFAYEVFVSDDGQTVVRLGPWARNMDDEAFSFFNEGKLMNEVLIKDLVDEGSVQKTVSHFFWKKNSGITSSGDQFVVDTLEGHAFTYDLKSGVLLNSSKSTVKTGRSSSRTCFGMIIGALLFAATVTSAGRSSLLRSMSQKRARR